MTRDTHDSLSFARGSIGPARLFGQDARYWFSPYMMIIGVVLPIIFWGLARRWPRSLFKYIDVSLILIGTSGIPPATGVNYVNFVVAGFLFREFSLLTSISYRETWSLTAGGAYLSVVEQNTVYGDIDPPFGPR